MTTINFTLSPFQRLDYDTTTSIIQFCDVNTLLKIEGCSKDCQKLVNQSHVWISLAQKYKIYPVSLDGSCIAKLENCQIKDRVIEGVRFAFKYFKDKDQNIASSASLPAEGIAHLFSSAAVKPALSSSKRPKKLSKQAPASNSKSKASSCTLAIYQSTIQEANSKVALDPRLHVFIASRIGTPVSKAPLSFVETAFVHLHVLNQTAITFNRFRTMDIVQAFVNKKVSPTQMNALLDILYKKGWQLTSPLHFTLTGYPEARKKLEELNIAPLQFN